MSVSLLTVMTLIFGLVAVREASCDCCCSKVTHGDDWIIIMQRLDGGLDFNRKWTDYRNGFSDNNRQNFWIGLENMHCITKSRGYAYELRIEMQGFENNVLYYAKYTDFSVENENANYSLNVEGYSGNAGDSLTNTSHGDRWYLNGKGFSTWDRDNDSGSRNCAQYYSAGWWFGQCWESLLTGQYGTNNFAWYSLHGLVAEGKLRFCRMMIRRKF